MSRALPAKPEAPEEKWLASLWFEETGEVHVWPNEEGHVECMRCACRPARDDVDPRVVLHRHILKVVN